MGLCEWRNAVGLAASGAALSSWSAGLTAQLLAPCLRTGPGGHAAGDEPRDLIREYYRLRRRARDLTGSADAAAGSSAFDAGHAPAAFLKLHLRFHGYSTGEWTDSAVRRYVRDAGLLLSRLHVLTRADCTTRNNAGAARLASAYDALEQRIAWLAKEEELARNRPDLDGNEIMRVLGLRPGPAVGEACRFLLDLRMEHGPPGRERAMAELLRWAREHGITPPAAGPHPDP